MRSWIELNVNALRHNVRVAQERAGLAKLCAVVKADAYGHGVEIIAPALADMVESFGVASLEEAKQVASLDLKRKIHILCPPLFEEYIPSVEAGFQLSLSSLKELEAVAQIIQGKRSTQQKQLQAQVWIQVDTGMGRSGCRSQELHALVARARELEEIHLLGLSTHCPSADEELEFTFAQLLRWDELTQASRENHKLSRQIANSAALLGYRRPADELARPGLMLYGVAPREEHQHQLQAVLSWKAKLSLVREVPSGTTVSYGRTWQAKRRTLLGTVSLGYADGYRRDYAKGAVLVRGKRCPIVGRVTMDQLVVDLTDLASALTKAKPLEAGEVVTLLGCDGQEEISAMELATRAGTIPWEVFTSISKRVARKIQH